MKVNLMRPRPKRPSPAQLRDVFGANLRHLAKQAPSVSALCRDLGINRTQFNRYLSGESFPRPDILHRICSHFNVDARILLEPVSDIQAASENPFQHPDLRHFVEKSTLHVREETFPSGFFLFVRPSFLLPDAFVRSMVYIYRKDGLTLLKGFEPRESVRRQGFSTARDTREFRGFLLVQDGGVGSLVCRRNAMTFSFTYLAPLTSFVENQWVGYSARTIRETPTSERVVRLFCEYLGRDTTRVLHAARTSGYCTEADLLPYQRSQMRPGEPFS